MDKELIHKAIDTLSQIDGRHLDACSIQELAQLQYWLMNHQGAIFVKTVGRLGLILKEELRAKDKNIELD